jgi:hypothetical protein
MLLRLARWGRWIALGLALLIWPASLLVASRARTYQQIAPFDDAVVAVNRLDYGDHPTGRDADVIAIYGTPLGAPTQYLGVQADQVVQPREKPSLRLLRRPQEGEPLQAKLVRALGLRASLAALAAAVLLALLAWLAGRRARRAPAPAP